MADSGFGAPALSKSRPVFGNWVTARLDGTADYFRTITTHTIDEFDGDWSICGWFNQDSAALKPLFEVSDNTANERITISITAAGAIEVTQVDTAGANTNTLTTTETGLAAGIWHHVTVTRTTNLFEVYINGGTADATTMSVTTRPDPDRMHLGTDRGIATFFAGYISQWMVFERALTVSQISRYSGSAYGNAQKTRGRHDWTFQFAITNLGPYDNIDLSQWPVTTHGTAPEHQWLTLPWTGNVVNSDHGTKGTWTILPVSVTDYRSEKGYYDSDISTLSPYDDLIDATTGGDWGFGDPDPDPVSPHDPAPYDRDLGFGSPSSYAPLEQDQVQLLAPLAQYGDDGGYVVEVLADWPEQGPYRFRFRDAGNNFYPTTGFCYSGVPTQGTNCYTLTGGVDIVRFISPPAPPGSYFLVIQWGPGFGSEVEVDLNGPVVVTRNRGLEVYALRRRLPKHYKSGPRVPRQDELLP